jgi:hypothetical protein
VTSALQRHSQRREHRAHRSFVYKLRTEE